MKINKLCNKITWDLDEIIFWPKNDDKFLFIEYINSIIPNHIDSEIELLTSFSQATRSKSKSQIEAHIMELEGFMFLGGQSFAKIAGSHDLAPTVLYDFKQMNVTINHPNTGDKLPNNISIEELISLLKSTSTVLKNLGF